MIGTKQNMKDTLRALGLRGIDQNVVRESAGTVLSAVRTVHHLATAEEVN